MLEVAIDWMASQWLELASLLIAIAALFYAALANNSSRKATTAAQASDLANLRIQANQCLAEANRSLLSLHSSCKANRADWEQFERKHMPSLGWTRPEPEQSNIAQVEREGNVLLQEIEDYFAPVDEMNAAQLEKGVQNARAAALEIEKLAGRLDGPPTHFN
ncbi:hypothetical protein [uncultured Hoeflea sp.]|uniref:hypothetical protein n=1 Tax=uncultured Hoeflea sp. TaxID=538666 RepID=UPI0030DC1390|tara:strand:+ start:167 stop:652 length:486 start_codon:yes stop_codon:yes gene_type:complete